MGRVSRTEAARHREQVVDAAARLFRQRGVKGASLADLMAEVGLTHGGFYRQFDSKEALAAEAATVAFGELTRSLEEISGRHPDDRDAAREELVAGYLSAAHRDDAGTGCPTSALSVDSAREEADSPLRSAYVDGVRDVARLLSDFSPEPAGREEHLATLATLVGALVLSRATAGDDISDEILAAARARLTDPDR